MIRCSTCLYVIAVFSGFVVYGDVSLQIQRSSEDVGRIKDFILKGQGKNSSFERLANITDTFGPRMSGSKNLEDAIDYIIKTMKEDGLHVYEEHVMVPNWQMLVGEGDIISSVRNKSLVIAPLGSSISGEVTAPVVVVRSFDELEARQAEIRGKIVVYNQACPNYFKCVVYRNNGASMASKYGAVASLTRSATQYSIYSVHTGNMIYENNVTKIPAACITIEDADFIQRFVDRGMQIQIHLNIQTTEKEPVQSRNIVAEIKGVQFPEEVVIFGGHTDSWYLTDGAMDDGGGLIISWEALRVIKLLNLQPRRTLRVVLWTSEENGLIGGKDYYEKHKNESDNVSLIMESDHGVFKPRGLKFTGSERARSILKEILSYFLSDIQATEVVLNGESSDTIWWINEKGVPGCELFSYNERYFDFHHSEGDTMSVLNADHMDQATALWATVVFAVSNLDEMLPRVDSSSLSFQNQLQFNQFLIIVMIVINVLAVLRA